MLDEMRSRGPEPSVVSYNAAISACAKGSEWEKALALWDEMERRGVAPDEASYSAAISACEKGGQWQRALLLLAELQTTGGGLDASAITYSTAITACQKAGQAASALDLLEDMKARGVAPDLGCYNAAMRALASTGELDPYCEAFVSYDSYTSSSQALGDEAEAPLLRYYSYTDRATRDDPESATDTPGYSAQLFWYNIRLQLSGPRG